MAAPEPGAESKTVNVERAQEMVAHVLRDELHDDEDRKQERKVHPQPSATEIDGFDPLA